MKKQNTPEKGAGLGKCFVSGCSRNAVAKMLMPGCETYVPVCAEHMEEEIKRDMCATERLAKRRDEE